MTKLILADWPAQAGIIAGCTTRTGGVSEGVYESLNLGAHVGDRADRVERNRNRLLREAGLPAEPAWLRQVHGTDVARLDELQTAEPEADAAVSGGGQRVLGILTADCLPVLICSTTSPELAALHCGWRSLAGGIIRHCVDRLASPAGNLLAWLGPAISQPAFEVGDEVRDAFLAGIEDAAACFEPNEKGRWQADLYALARLHLGQAGVESVYGGGLCTFGDSARFFSYRRDGQCGRMASFIGRTGSP